MFSNSATSSRRPLISSEYWKSWPFGAGGAPTWRQAPRLQQIRVHPNPHGVLTGAEYRHGANALEASQFVLHADDGVVRQIQAVEAAVRRNQRDEFEKRTRLF
jgi:hypothetical protein